MLSLIRVGGGTVTMVCDNTDMVPSLLTLLGAESITHTPRHTVRDRHADNDCESSVCADVHYWNTSEYCPPVETNPNKSHNRVVAHHRTMGNPPPPCPH